MKTKEDIQRIAKLANLTISNQELESYTKDITSILNYIDNLNEINTDNIEPMSHVHGITNILRADEVEPSMPTDEALEIAPDSSEQFFRVPLIIKPDTNK